MLNQVRWKPPGSIEVTVPGVDAVAYVTENTAIGYKGKANKPAFNYRFRDAQQRQTYVAGFFEKVKAAQDWTATKAAMRKAERASWVPDLQPGDVLYGSWGYDQTNVEFVKVLEVKGKRALVQELQVHCPETSFMSGQATPTETLVGEPKWKPMLMGYKGSTRIKWTDYCDLTKWDGQPKHMSWYA